MATIAIGDVHGNLLALSDLLGRVRPEVAAGDTVVFLGDYLDRGVDVKQCIDAILAFRTQVPAKVVCLRGNHEDWFLRTRRDYTRHSWLTGMDGFGTVRSYSRTAARALREAIVTLGLRLFTERCVLPYGAFFDAMPASHLEFLDSLSLFYETPDCICVHAGWDGSPQAGKPSSEVLLWGDEHFLDTYAGDRVVVYGHWDNAEIDSRGWPRPRFAGRTIGIDTISHGVLTAVRLPDRQVFQSRKHAL